MPPVRVPALGLGLAYLFSVVALGPLLGSTADSSVAYEVHFANDASVTRDLLGALGLVLTSAMLVWLVMAFRGQMVDRGALTRSDLACAFGLVASAALLAAAGLLLTVPFTVTLGRVTDDPGISPDVQAGIAQAGSVALFVAVLPLAIAVVLLSKVATTVGSSPRWIAGAAWVTAVLLFFGWSVGLLLPFAAWSIAFGFTSRSPDGRDRAPGLTAS